MYACDCVLAAALLVIDMPLCISRSTHVRARRFASVWPAEDAYIMYDAYAHANSTQHGLQRTHISRVTHVHTRRFNSTRPLEEAYIARNACAYTQIRLDTAFRGRIYRT